MPFRYRRHCFKKKSQIRQQEVIEKILGIFHYDDIGVFDRVERKRSKVIIKRNIQIRILQKKWKVNSSQTQIIYQPTFVL